MSKTKNLEKIYDEAENIFSGISESCIDSVLRDGIFRDIPIISTLLSFARVGISISDFLLLKKIKCLYDGLFINENELTAFKIKLKNVKFTETVAMKLLNIVDHADDDTKTQWIATLFRDYLNKGINHDFFLRVLNAINNCFPPDIECLKLFHNEEVIYGNNKHIEYYVLESLFTAGVISSCGFSGGDASGNNSGTAFGINEIGTYFVEKFFKEE